MRQGGVLSTSHYKRYNNPLLLQLEERYTDVKLGQLTSLISRLLTILLYRSYGSQQIKIWDVDNNTCRERYCVNPVKSSTLFYPFSRGNGSECTDIFMAGDKISNDSNTTHFGIYRDITDKPSIEEKNSIGRKTAYFLMGAGFHSGNGLKVCLNGFIWSTFVLPRLTYGLEVLLLREKDFELLEKFQRKSLTQTQALPDKTPNAVVLALLGILPAEVTIHKNSLNLFMSIISDKASTEYQIAERQCLLWKIIMRKVGLTALDLPWKRTICHQLFHQEISKSEWKRLLNISTNSYVEASWKAEAETKTSLKYVNPDILKVGQSHPVWSTVRCSIMDNKRAQLKCILLTGTYILQGNRAAFNQHTVDPTCKLCSVAPETRQHFISECSVFERERQEFLDKLRNNPVLSGKVKDYIQAPELLTQLVLDASMVLDPRDTHWESWIYWNCSQESTSIRFIRGESLS